MADKKEKRVYLYHGNQAVWQSRLKRLRTTTNLVMECKNLPATLTTKEIEMFNKESKRLVKALEDNKAFVNIPSDIPRNLAECLTLTNVKPVSPDRIPKGRINRFITLIEHSELVFTEKDSPYLKAVYDLKNRIRDKAGEYLSKKQKRIFGVSG
jgi:hypothetical protein